MLNRITRPEGGIGRFRPKWPKCRSVKKFVFVPENDWKELQRSYKKVTTHSSISKKSREPENGTQGSENIAVSDNVNTFYDSY
ncbi:hypothetical protein DLM75_10375 [Leptospira stimsonii]|uniref:Uncharacterized protein n=1 Tax=Leptospira stimsonii TaxID=2202203 RepID=A0A396Z5P8_9LEPT|nr:hypothetical protein DLM75_10375 [Leptospira stimsonii]